MRTLQLHIISIPLEGVYKKKKKILLHGRWRLSFILHTYTSAESDPTHSSTGFLNLPLIQAAYRASYRVKVTGTFGGIKSAAGADADAPHEPW